MSPLLCAADRGHGTLELATCLGPGPSTGPAPLIAGSRVSNHRLTTHTRYNQATRQNGILGPNVFLLSKDLKFTF